VTYINTLYRWATLSPWYVHDSSRLQFSCGFNHQWIYICKLLQTFIPVIHPITHQNNSICISKTHKRTRFIHKKVIEPPIPPNIRELKHVGRQHDDDGQNKFLQINDSKENLSYIIIRMNLVQYKMLKTLALCLERVLLNRRILSCTCYGLKCRRCIKDVKICDLPL
jgi:hypothetical protein